MASPPRHHPSSNGHRYSRRRRRPTQWDVRTPPYGIPMPPPGSAVSATSRAAVTPRVDAVQRGYVPGPNDIVRAPAAGESGPLAGINIDALRTLLNPRGVREAARPVADLSGVRHARRLYVGNLPNDTTDGELGEFFNKALIASRGVESEGNPIVSVYMNVEKRFAFIETRTVREAAAGLMLDGVKFKEAFLRLRRPNDFQGGEMVKPPQGFNAGLLGIVSTQVGDGPNKVFIGGIPYNLTEDQIKSLLQSYGALAAFNLIKEPNTGQSKGFAFFEFVDPGIVDVACKGLHGMQVGDKTLTVRRATSTGGGLVVESRRVVELRNVVGKEEVEDDGEYEEIREDIEEEGSKFGHLEKVVIPREGGGVGKVYLKYALKEEAERAHAALGGRKFGERTVEAAYFDEELFERAEFS